MGDIYDFRTFKGGIGALSDALVSSLTDNGGEIRFKTTVERFLTKGNKVTGVELRNGEKISSKVVLSSLDSITNKAVLTHKYFESKFGITGGDFTHGLIQPSQWWDNRPIKGWSNYRTPLDNLYMCGSSSHSGL